MTKKKPQIPPISETPNEGGSYLRNPRTGKPELVKPPVKPAEQGAET